MSPAPLARDLAPLWAPGRGSRIIFALRSMPLDDPRSDTVLRTIAFAAVDSLLILCHTSAPPSDAEWDTLIAYEVGHPQRGLLISTDGGAPNSRQRARVAEARRGMIDAKRPVALLTDSAVTRSIMTAFAWILGQEHPMKTFPRDGLDEAVSWLGVEVPPARVRPVMERLHTSLGRPSTKSFLR
jgi:hypothetical protein